MSDATSLLLAGVGGQGTVLASAILAEALLRSGYDVKQSEVHGMAQRGGSVVSHVRFGSEVASPIIPLGGADVLVGFEWAETLRWLPYVGKGGSVIADVRRVMPPMALRDRSHWETPYPPLLVETVKDRVAHARTIDAWAVAAGLGNGKAANSVMLGAVSNLIEVPDEAWEAALLSWVPKGTEELNVRAFHAGREAPAPIIARAEALASGAARRSAPDIEFDSRWCKGCDICVRVCPEYSLGLDENALAFAARPEVCTGCRLCELLCPDFAITIHDTPERRGEPILGGPA